MCKNSKIPWLTTFKWTIILLYYIKGFWLSWLFFIVIFFRADLEEKLAYEAATLSSNSSTTSEDLTEMRKRNISIYGSLVGGTFVFAFGTAFVFLSIAVSASQNLHNKMFSKLLGATTYFFDTNPAGKSCLINLN